MRLFYSGAKQSLVPQPNPDESLGGYISTTFVENDYLNNFFSEISHLSITQKKRNTKLFVLKNTTGAAVTNIRVHFEYPTNPKAKILLGAVTPGTDSLGNPAFELLSSSNSKPLNVTFYEANGSGNTLNLGALNNNQYIGIWLTRELLPDTLLPKTAEQLESEEYKETEEKVDMVIQWD